MHHDGATLPRHGLATHIAIAQSATGVSGAARRNAELVRPTG
jgi:hypothetical protein